MRILDSNQLLRVHLMGASYRPVIMRSLCWIEFTISIIHIFTMSQLELPTFRLVSKGIYATTTRVSTIRHPQKDSWPSWFGLADTIFTLSLNENSYMYS